MKKIIAIFLLLIFLISNTGLAITAHYCGGKLSAIIFLSINHHSCKCGKKAMKKDCCKDKIVMIKSTTNSIKSQLIVKTPNSTQFLGFLYNKAAITPIKIDSEVSKLYSLPPYKPKAPIYLLDGVFRI